MFGIPKKIFNKLSDFNHIFNRRNNKYSFIPENQSPLEQVWSVITFFLGTVALLSVITMTYTPIGKLVSPLVAQLSSLKPLPQDNKTDHEVFGFAPYWTINKMDSVDFTSLTTLAYFSAPILADGSLDRESQGYQVFKSSKATELFKKAHSFGTRVVLTLTCMDNDTIEAFLADNDAQQIAIEQAVNEVQERGIDGINVDVEYIGTPDAYYRNQFSLFVHNLTEKMHQANNQSRVSVSVYALSARDTKLFDIAKLAESSDAIFMMAYDFAVTGSEKAMPTAPLYGYKAGKYNYDIATAVDDFSKLMPLSKLILGVPYYGYNYLIYGEPKVNADTRPTWSWRGRPLVQTYEIAEDNIKVMREGWDDLGQVGWRAYYIAETDTWRMIFLDDARSLAIKYDFAKAKKLAGIGIWALGFDYGKDELWSVIKQKFGPNNLAENLKLSEIN